MGRSSYDLNCAVKPRRDSECSRLRRRYIGLDYILFDDDSSCKRQTIYIDFYRPTIRCDNSDYWCQCCFQDDFSNTIIDHLIFKHESLSHLYIKFQRYINTSRNRHRHYNSRHTSHWPFGFHMVVSPAPQKKSSGCRGGSTRDTRWRTPRASERDQRPPIYRIESAILYVRSRRSPHTRNEQRSTTI